jgi:hypothetical protein
MKFTPLFPSRDLPDYDREVAPGFLSVGDNVKNYLHKTVVSEINVVSLEISAIICTHSEGKSWQSIFLPTNSSSMNGVSITWWNRKPGLPGQVNVKAESSQQWYATVGSKVIAKGYEVLAYCGRETGWNRNQSWCSELHKKDVAIHQLGISTGELRDMVAKNGFEEVGEKIANSMMANPVVSGLIRRISRAGLLEQALKEADYLVGVERTENMTLSVMLPAVRSLLTATLSSKGFDDEASGEVYTASRVYAPKEAKPVKEVKMPEQVYSAWGAFG